RPPPPLLPIAGQELRPRTPARRALVAALGRNQVTFAPAANREDATGGRAVAFYRVARWPGGGTALVESLDSGRFYLMRVDGGAITDVQEARTPAAVTPATPARAAAAPGATADGGDPRVRGTDGARPSPDSRGV